MPDINVPVGSHPTTHAQLPGNQFAPQVVVVDPATGLPVAFGGGGSGLTDGQLRAAPVGVIVGPRVCLKTYSFALTDSSQTLAQAIGEAIPTGAVTCEIQAQGGSIRIKRDGGTVTASAGYRLDDGVKEVIDSVLADIRLIRQSAVTTVANIAFFNRV